MRKMKLIVGLLVILSMALAPTAFAAKREKFGVDKRHEEVKKRTAHHQTFRRGIQVEDGHAVVQRAVVLRCRTTFC